MISGTATPPLHFFHSAPIPSTCIQPLPRGRNGSAHAPASNSCSYRPPSPPLPLPPSGSRATLLEEPRAKGLDPRQGVVDFHSQHYSANICRLAVFGKHSLDELEAMVRPRFTEVSALRRAAPPLPYLPGPQ